MKNTYLCDMGFIIGTVLVGTIQAAPVVAFWTRYPEAFWLRIKKHLMGSPGVFSFPLKLTGSEAFVGFVIPKIERWYRLCFDIRDSHFTHVRFHIQDFT